MSEISITFAGRKVLTLDQIAERVPTLKDGESARAVLRRAGKKPAAHVGAVYFEDEVTEFFATRPGRPTGRPRKSPPA